MTDDNGQILPECAAAMAVLKTNVEILQATGKSFSCTAGEIRETVSKLDSTVSGHAVVLTEMRGALNDEVLPVIRGLKPLAEAMQTKQTRDITRRILTSSAPDDPIAEVKRSGLITRERLIQAAIALILAISGAIAGYQSNGREDQSTRRTIQKGGSHETYQEKEDTDD